METKPKWLLGPRGGPATFHNMFSTTTSVSEMTLGGIQADVFNGYIFILITFNWETIHCYYVKSVISQHDF